MTATAVRVDRQTGIDAIRGAAIALMVTDHVLLVAGAPEWTRLGPTRLAMPAFALVAGALPGRPHVRPRQIAAAAAAAVACTYAGIPGPLFLAALVLAIAAVRAFPTAAVAVVAVAATLAANGVALAGTTGYELPGLVALVALGRLAAPQIHHAAARLPRLDVLELAGRHPLGLYVGHLAALAVIVQAAR